MRVFDPTDGKPDMPQSGTFAGNPVTMAAGVASMNLLTLEEFERLNRLGELARNRLRDVIQAAGVPGQVTGLGSLFRIHLTERTLHGYRDAYPTPEERENLNKLYHYLLEHGVLIASSGMCALTTPMCEAEIELLAERVDDGLASLP